MTGAAGFIGSNLLEELLKRGYEVLGIDNMSHAHPRNIKNFKLGKNFTFIRGDITNKKIFEHISNIDSIIHLAALKIPKFGGVIKTMEVNAQGTKNVLEFAKKHKTKVIFSSSSDVYGMAHVPFKEDTNLVLGSSKVKRWCYSASKLFDEHLCFGYYYEERVPVVIMRFFNVYGPRNLEPEKKNRWFGGPFPVFIEAALDNEPIVVHGSGRQLRAFTYVSDAVDGIMRCLEIDAAIGDIFNIGNIKEYAILDVAKMIKNRVQSDSKIIFVKHEKLFGKYDEVERRIPDIKKSENVLGFKAKIGIDEGLDKTIEWHRSLRENK